ncbi:MAG: CYTH domain-containing protein [Candidatus Palauibacterales bacterium]|nr:CYTH domain-containing protein [Candidatus Palauibacterales bacterium]
MPEVEATLAVTSETPAEVAERIAALDGLGPYRFRWLDVRELRDVYLDTAARELGDRALALRLRREGTGWRITLKGPGRPAAGGAVERSELELKWSPAALGRILAALRDHGVELPDAASAVSGADAGDPVDAVRAAGFRVLQDRRTRRARARVARADGRNGTLAWLVVDAVRYRTASGRAVRHREVEIEATPAAPEGVPGEVAGLLRRRFGDALRTWEHPKLATGQAVAGTEPPAGPDGDLLPAAYDRLERELSGGGAGK